MFVLNVTGAVDVKFAELIQVWDPGVQNDEATHGQTSDSPGVPIWPCAICFLNMWQDALEEFASTGIRFTGHGSCERCEPSCVRHDNDHRNRLLLGDQIIEDHVRMAAIGSRSRPL